MSEKNEPIVGEDFHWEGKKYTVHPLNTEAGFGCKTCAFHHVCCVDIICNSASRNDHQAVYLKEKKLLKIKMDDDVATLELKLRHGDQEELLEYVTTSVIKYLRELGLVWNGCMMDYDKYVYNEGKVTIHVVGNLEKLTKLKEKVKGDLTWEK